MCGSNTIIQSKSLTKLVDRFNLTSLHTHYPTIPNGCLTSLTSSLMCWRYKNRRNLTEINGLNHSKRNKEPKRCKWAKHVVT